MDDSPTIAEALNWSVKGIPIAHTTADQIARHLIDACKALASIQATAQRISDCRARGIDSMTTQRLREILAWCDEFGAG